MASLVTTGPAALYATLFAVGFALLSVAVGRRTMIWLGVSGDAGLVERGVLAMVLGAGVLQFVPFVLGVAGVLSPFRVRIACLVVAAAAARDLLAVLRRAGASIRGLVRPRIWFGVWLLALVPGLASALLSAWTPALDPDGLGYHLTVPKRWLSMGHLGYLPTYPYSNAPMGVEMLFALGLSWSGDTAAKTIHVLLGVTAAIGLYCAAKRVANDVLAMLAVALFLFGPLGLGVFLGFAYVEGAASAALIASALAWLIWYQGRQAGFLRVSALLAGVGLTFKLTTALFPVALGALTVLILWREARDQGRQARSNLSPLPRVVPFVALPVLPWLIRSTIVTGNPFFPLLAEWIPSRDFTAQQAAKFDQYNRYLLWAIHYNWSLGLREKILAAAAVAVVVVGIVVYRWVRSFAARSTTLVVVATMLVQLGAVGLYKRYWIPLLSIVELPVLLLLAGLLLRPWIRPIVLALTVALSLYSARTILRNQNGDTSASVKTSLGIESQEAFLDSHLPVLTIYEKINGQLPKDAGVMLAAECAGFYIDRRTFCLDIVQNSLRLSSWPDFVKDMRRLHVTDVIAPLDWEQPAQPSSGPTQVPGGSVGFLVRPQERETVGRLLHDHSHLIASDSDQGLFAIDLGGLDR
jgi:hypothetical protein